MSVNLYIYIYIYLVVTRFIHVYGRNKLNVSGKVFPHSSTNEFYMALTSLSLVLVM